MSKLAVPETPLTDAARKAIENVTFTPKQQQYLSSSSRFLLYGGGAGGGKTHVAIYDMLGLNNPGNGVRAIDVPEYTGIFFRRTLKQLSDVIRRTKSIYPIWGRDPRTGQEPIFREQQKTWVFPSGAQILFGYIQYPGDEENYQGWEYQNICFEELTQWPSSHPFLYMHSRLRKKDDNPVQLGMRATCNPGGVGHQWVRSFWDIDDSGSPQKFTLPIEITLNGKTKVVEMTRQFIPSRLDENPFLSQEEYAAVLEDPNMSSNMRRALRHGRWDIIDVRGVIYAEQINQLHNEGHVREVPYDPRYPVNTFWDMGVADQTAVWFHQRVDGVDRFIDYYYAANLGIKDHWRALQNKPYSYAAHFLPHDAAHRKHNAEGALMTIEDIMQNIGMRNTYVVPRTPSLAQGIEQVRAILPRCVFDWGKCEDGIAALTNYRFPVKDDGTISARPVHDKHSHGADAFRQFAQSVDEVEDVAHSLREAAEAEQVPDVPHARHREKALLNLERRWVV